MIVRRRVEMIGGDGDVVAEVGGNGPGEVRPGCSRSSVTCGLPG